MYPDRALESDALPIALRYPACKMEVSDHNARTCMYNARIGTLN